MKKSKKEYSVNISESFKKAKGGVIFWKKVNTYRRRVIAR